MRCSGAFAGGVRRGQVGWLTVHRAVTDRWYKAGAGRRLPVSCWSQSPQLGSPPAGAQVGREGRKGAAVPLCPCPLAGLLAPSHGTRLCLVSLRSVYCLRGLPGAQWPPGRP